MTYANSRQADHPIDTVFLERWSPRAMSGAEISEEELLTLLEAARWAPSAFNIQPWRFIYARRGTPFWDKVLGVLNPFNQSWAKNASALVVVLSSSMVRTPGADHDTPSYSHSFDAGAAWSALAHQAVKSGWHVHAMTGVDFDKAHADLAIPEVYRIEAAVAIGKLGDKSILPEGLQAREQPSPRKPLSEIAFEGSFPAA
ncbi:Nitroreductase family protein [Pseudoxanthobacter soli DSM 19599]|uniref:Nitroreductase family protein n=1 Tax=Pseudoxanthobacter soli DSM 19599 TaxID=1123029 RepID=A0A1M7ZL16_9HYPH|nr:nitroreductase family protein [Pseudoxanthobacter soli]SHO65512.1 Nitroreductase family protein [Pseudoxanthobacter soli DSM 19599]